MEGPLITVDKLAERLGDPEWVIVDCRAVLGDGSQGLKEYAREHLPGAVYVSLDQDLSAPVIQGVTGRHPLPEIAALVGTFSRLGIGPRVQVAAYDDANGAMAAGRLWWLLRWLGHSQVQVLDGGWKHWKAASLPTRSGVETNPARIFQPALQAQLLALVEDVERTRHLADHCLLDARSEERYHGQNETIDPVAGHIPGAISAPYMANTGPDGKFRSPEELRRRFQALLGGIPPERATVYCGSGVTAVHNLLAMEVAGLPGARLYNGSWSEWITDPARPVGT